MSDKPREKFFTSYGYEYEPPDKQGIITVDVPDGESWISFSFSREDLEEMLGTFVNGD